MDEELSHNQITNARDHLSPLVYEELDFAADLPDFTYDAADLTLEQDPHYTGKASHSKHFSVDGTLLAPFSLNLGASRLNFNHLRNVSLDDSNYRQTYSMPAYQCHNHSMLVNSTSAEPPSGTFSHSYSTSTLQLIDLIPQLLLLMSNKLLPDSPFLNMASAATPGCRRLSTSHSSNNIYTTPLRGAQSPGMKVGKTPLRSHRRTGLRASELGLLQLLANIANMKNLASHDPFDSTFISPRMALDCDSTPLATPAQDYANSQYFTPISHRLSFGGNLDHALHSKANRTPASTARLVRNNTLSPIKMEDQDDDAHVALRKAKSFTMTDPRAAMPTSTSGRNLKGENNRLFRSMASIDLLLPKIVEDRTSALKSYPASIDLASITRLGSVHTTPLPTGSARLMPALPPSRSTSHIYTVAEASSSHSSLHSNPYHTDLAPNTASYPTPSQIHETSATEEIAKFAESILKSNMKRPIVVQEDTNDTFDPKKKHKCPLCLARFQRPEHVKRHLKSHSTEKPFECDYPDCGRRFNRKDNLKAHLKKIHHKTC